MPFPYTDRIEAGQHLGRILQERLPTTSNTLILALPRGGVPVAAEIARLLSTPLDVLVVRKLGLPEQEELAMGAIASGGIRVLNDEMIRQLNIPDSVIDDVAAREGMELQRRERVYRGDRPVPAISGRHIILVDDGIATGATVRAAVSALRQRRPARITVAVPVAPPETVAELRQEADEVVCAETPQPFFGVGRWYQRFDQTEDAEVRTLLDQFGTPP